MFAEFLARNCSRLLLRPLEQLPMKDSRWCISRTTSPQLHPSDMLFYFLQQQRNLTSCIVVQQS